MHITKSERKGVIFHQGRGNFSTQKHWYASFVIVFDNIIYKSEYTKKAGAKYALDTSSISYEFYLVEGLYVDTLISHQEMEQTLQIPFLV